MNQRDYYGVRTGNQSGEIQLTFEELKKLVLSLFKKFEGQGYFAEAFGQDCVDDGPTIGRMGTDIALFVSLQLEKRDLWPIQHQIDKYSAEDLFSILELLYDYVSKPNGSHYHQWDNCGFHYYDFDAKSGKEEFRAELNYGLRHLSPIKYELSPQGEILEIPADGLETLIEQHLPANQPDSIESKLSSAIRKFRKYSSTIDERREAVRDLADILEYIRPKITKVISSKDENDLFSIANKFAIRHHNPTQKADYNQELWIRWMFYTYLATIHVVLGTLAKSGIQP